MNNVKHRNAKNLKINMKKLDINILELSKIRWPDNGNFWCDNIRVIHANNTNGQAGVGIGLNNKWSTRVTSVVTHCNRLCLVKME